MCGFSFFVVFATAAIGHPNEGGDGMNRWCKLSLIGLMGLGAVCVVYPCLHELGHSIMAYVCGAQEVRMGVFPIAYTAYKNTETSLISQVLVGLSGYVFPLCLTLLPTANRFWVWLFMFYVRWTTLCGCGIAIAGLLGAAIRGVYVEEDITRLAMMTQSRAEVWLVGVFLAAVWLLWDIVRQKPIARIFEYIYIS